MPSNRSNSRAVVLAFIAGAVVSFLTQTATNVTSAHASDGQVDALRDIARAIENKECK